MFSWVRIAMRARSLKGKKGKEADMGRRACVMHTCVLCSFIILSCFSLLLAFLQVRSFFFFFLIWLLQVLVVDIGSSIFVAVCRIF